MASRAACVPGRCVLSRATRQRLPSRRRRALQAAGGAPGQPDDPWTAPGQPDDPARPAPLEGAGLGARGGWLGSPAGEGEAERVLSPATARAAAAAAAAGAVAEGEARAVGAGDAPGAAAAPWVRAEAEEAQLELLEGSLRYAVEKEDFDTAALLRDQAAQLRAGDAAGKVLEASQRAVEEERYEEAAALRDGGAGLVGWWAADQTADGRPLPSGHVLCVSAQHGRFVGRTVRPVDLAEASDGVPALEMFPREVEPGRYELDVFATGDPLLAEGEEGGEAEGAAAGSSSNGDGDSDGSLTAPAGASGLWAEAQEQLMNVLSMSQSDERANGKAGKAGEAGEAGEEEVVVREFHRDDGTDAGRTPPFEGRWEAGAEPERSLELERKPASLAWRGGPSSFEMRVAGADAAAVDAWCDAQMSKDMLMSAVDVGLPDPSAEGGMAMPLRDALTDIGTRVEDLAGSNVSIVVDDEDSDDEEGRAAEEQLRAILEAEFSRMQSRMGQAPPSALYRRLDTESRGTMQGLFIGSFGPHGPEAVQLTMHEARHVMADGEGRPGDEDELCVIGTKVTGDNNVPAGEVTFRARVGRQSRLDPREVFPDDLGVTARYPGQGRVAQAGFAEPAWVDGELLLFDSRGRGGDMTGGAEVGFVFAVPGERRFLVLFNRLVPSKHNDGRMDVLIKGVRASSSS